MKKEKNTPITKGNFLTFAAINKVEEIKVISNIENTQKKDDSWVDWGEKNLYAPFVFETYERSQSLKTIVDAIKVFVVGNGLTSTAGQSEEELEMIVGALAEQYAIYGGFAINVLRNRMGGIAKLVPMDIKCLRTNKANDIFWYSESFGKKKGQSKCQATQYPRFDKDEKSVVSSVFYYKNTLFNVYPQPVWGASVDAALIEAMVGTYHRNNLMNGFAATTMVCLNNGTPDDEEKAEIERNFEEKFQGVDNAGSVILAFSDDKDHCPEIKNVTVNDFADQYKALTDYCTDKLFSSFRMNPNLAGFATEGTGFAGEEYENTFKIFNRTVVRGIQKAICNAFDRIYGEQDVLSIEPFALENNVEKVVE